MGCRGSLSHGLAGHRRREEAYKSPPAQDRREPSPPWKRALLSACASHQLPLREGCGSCPPPEPLGASRRRCSTVLWGLVCRAKLWDADLRLLFAERPICPRYVHEHSSLDGTAKSDRSDYTACVIRPRPRSLQHSTPHPPQGGVNPPLNLRSRRLRRRENRPDGPDLVGCGPGAGRPGVGGRANGP